MECAKELIKPSIIHTNFNFLFPAASFATQSARFVSDICLFLERNINILAIRVVCLVLKMYFESKPDQKHWMIIANNKMEHLKIAIKYV
jgi:hypothetical protein